jgi:hypothetical protein
MRMRKSSKLRNTQVFTALKAGIQQGTLNNPLSPGSITATQIAGGNGDIAYAAFEDSSGALCAYFRLNPVAPVDTPISSNPAVTVSWSVIEPTNSNPVLSKLSVHGNPPSGNAYAYEFEVQYPCQVPQYQTQTSPPTIPDSRLAIKVVELTTWPTVAFAQSIAAVKWQDCQKAFHMALVKLARFDPNWQPGDRFPSTSGNLSADMRVEVNEWSVSPSSKSQSLQGFCPRPIPTGAEAVLVSD